MDPGLRRDDAFGARRLLSFLFAAFLALLQTPVLAAEPPQCARGDMVLWGDGVHDDTAALNAWLRGDSLVWATSGEPVGEAIANRVFRLSSAIYVPAAPAESSNIFAWCGPSAAKPLPAAASDPAKIPTRRRS